MRLIDAEHLKTRATDTTGDCWDNYGQGTADFLEYIDKEPTVDAEPTEEQVKKYCYKRCLVIVTSRLFNEMKARWSVEPMRHGHWIGKEDHKWHCSKCDGIAPKGRIYNYCPFCGAKMDEVEDV